MLHFQLSSFSFDLLSSYLSLLLICRNNSLASSHVCLMFKERRPLYQILDLLYEVLCNVFKYMRCTNDYSGTHSYTEESTNMCPITCILFVFIKCRLLKVSFLIDGSFFHFTHYQRKYGCVLPWKIDNSTIPSTYCTTHFNLLWSEVYCYVVYLILWLFKLLCKVSYNNVLIPTEKLAWQIVVNIHLFNKNY